MRLLVDSGSVLVGEAMDSGLEPFGCCCLSFLAIGLMNALSLRFLEFLAIAKMVGGRDLDLRRPTDRLATKDLPFLDISSQ